MRQEHEQGSQPSVRGEAGNGPSRAPASEPARQPHADVSNSWPSRSRTRLGTFPQPAERSRLPPEQKPRKSHRMPHQPKRPRILRPRTAGRHCVAQPLTCPPAQRPHPPAPTQAGPDQRTPPTRDAMHRLHAPMPLSRPPPRTHVAPAHPAHRNDPNTHVQACTH